MQYSEYPHEHYVVDGVGPGSNFVGDLERWNWRWLLVGTALNPAYDLGLASFFNDSQRRLMTLPPAEALGHLVTFMPDDITDEVWNRVDDYTTRLFKLPATPLVKSREGNVIIGNFGKK